jgi:tousled-like kinase
MRDCSTQKKKEHCKSIIPLVFFFFYSSILFSLYQFHRMAKMLEDHLRKTAFQDFLNKRERLAKDSVRVGKISMMKSPVTSGVIRGGTPTSEYHETIDEGYAFKELAKRYGELIQRKEQLDERKKRLTNRKKQMKKDKELKEKELKPEELLIDPQSVALKIEEMQSVDGEIELAAEQEMLRAHTDQWKRDEASLAEEKRLLLTEQGVFIKEFKRCQAEERSRFYSQLPTLHQRYVLQCMLGRGGFSEVWKAFDLVELREVAVKIHQLNPQWQDQKKESYIKHVTREYTIHREMKHDRVVKLYDVFEIDVNSFATVLEYCKGIDLEEK